MTYEIYLLLGLLATICIVVVCLCMERFLDIEDNLAPPPCNTADWQAIEREARAVQDKAQAEFKNRQHSPQRPQR